MKGTGFSQNSSAVTRDLLYDKHTNKRFIAVETRNGHTLYLVIDYDKPLDEDGERYETYFLNLVDESDLLALIDRFRPRLLLQGQVRGRCSPFRLRSLQKNNMTGAWAKEKAHGKTPEPDPTPDTSDSPDKDGGEKEVRQRSCCDLLLLLMAGGGALYWFKLRKKKPDTRDLWTWTITTTAMRMKTRNTKTRTMRTGRRKWRTRMHGPFPKTRWSG